MAPSVFFLCVTLAARLLTICFSTRFLCLLFAYSLSVKILYGGLTEVLIVSPFCEQVHEGQVERNHLL